MRSERLMKVIAIRGTGEVNMPLGEHSLPDDLVPGGTFTLTDYPDVQFTTMNIVHGVVRGRVAVDVYDRTFAGKGAQGVAA